MTNLAQTRNRSKINRVHDELHPATNRGGSSPKRLSIAARVSSSSGYPSAAPASRPLPRSAV